MQSKCSELPGHAPSMATSSLSHLHAHNLTTCSPNASSGNHQALHETSDATSSAEN